MTNQIKTIRIRTVLAGLALALLLALSGSFTLADSAEAQSKSLRFDDPPTQAEVSYGSADKNVVKVKASGIENSKRIRYSISGDSAFSITPRGGRVMYDGSRTESDSVQLTVTARDRKGKYASASFKLRVTVQGLPSQAQRQLAPTPTPTPKPKPTSTVRTYDICEVGLDLSVGQGCHVWATFTVEVLEDGRALFGHKCYSSDSCTETVFDTSFTKHGLGAEKGQGKWTITSLPASTPLPSLPTPTQHCRVGLVLNAGESCIMPSEQDVHQTQIHFHSNGNLYYRYLHCFRFEGARCTGRASDPAENTVNGLTVEKREGKWTVTKIPTKKYLNW